MAGKRILKHTHKLKRHIHGNKEAVFFCTLGECEYKINVALALGKPNLCWRCGKPFNLNEYALRLAKPHCSDCKKSKEKFELDDLVKLAVPDYPGRPTLANDKPIPTDDLLSRLRKTIEHGVAGTVLDESTKDDLL